MPFQKIFYSALSIECLLLKKIKSYVHFIRLQDLWTNPYKAIQIEHFWIFTYKSNPRNKPFEDQRSNQIHKTNLLNTVGWNESTKHTFWTGYTFANPKLRICMDSDLFIVSLCTKDSWGFVRIHWIHENWLNLFKISLLFKSTNESKENSKDLSHKTNPKSGFVL
jgi:hypothetical protein